MCVCVRQRERERGGGAELVCFPDPPLLHKKEGLVEKVIILGCADSAVVGNCITKSDSHVIMLCANLDYRTSWQFIDTLHHMIF